MPCCHTYQTVRHEISSLRFRQPAAFSSLRRWIVEGVLVFCLLGSVWNGRAFAQSAALYVADSLARIGLHRRAILIYDSVAEAPASDISSRLYALGSAAEAYTALSIDSTAEARAEAALRLAQERQDTLAMGSSLQVLAILLPPQAVAQADSLLAEAQRCYEKAHATSSLGYGRLLRRMGNIAHARGRFAEAESLWTQARQILAHVSPPVPLEISAVLNNLAVLYYDAGRFGAAEKVLLDLQNTLQTTLSEAHPYYASVLNNLASLYRETGRYAQAESLFLQIKSLREKILDKKHVEYITTLGNLSTVYQEQGRYPEAEKLLRETKLLFESAVGKTHPAYADILNNLGVLCRVQGRYEEAEKLYTEAMMLRESMLGIEHPAFSSTLNNLANIYRLRGRYAEAESLFISLIRLRASVIGETHPDYWRAMHNLASLYEEQGRYAEAESLYIQVKNARQNSDNRADYAGTLSGIAGIYFRQGRFAEAETLYQQVARIYLQVLDEKHPEYLSTLYNLAHIWASTGQYKQADSLWQIVILRLYDRIRIEFPVMPTHERQQMLENIMQVYLQGLQAYATLQTDPKIIQLAYRSARSLKGMLLSSTEGMRYLLESRRQSDTLLYGWYQQWKGLVELYVFHSLREETAAADSVRQIALSLERQMMERLPELTRYFPDLQNEPLYPPLQKGEVAIEVVRLPHEKNDSVSYLYYIITQERKSPTLRLFVRTVSKAWEFQAANAYSILRSPESRITGTAYKLIWAFVDSVLPARTKKIYFSPDGIYYQVNLGMLYDADTKQYLTDRYAVEYVASTRRLLFKPDPAKGNAPVIIGNPDFGSAPPNIQPVGIQTRRYFADGIPSLPGAEKEAKQIAHILSVSPVTGSAATESYIKSLHSPHILHIATHGYFISEDEDPMLSGGLLFAQAMFWDSLYAPFGTEDGRLTAQEACNLDLQQTELVVLSACETALGVVRGEGLYGLQRAFLEAGAHSVISTLWSIDDAATQQLMTLFYQHWKKAHKARHPQGTPRIFSAAVRDFRRQYPHPYYWGAFIVMQ